MLQCCKSKVTLPKLLELCLGKRSESCLSFLTHFSLRENLNRLQGEFAQAKPACAAQHEASLCNVLGVLLSPFKLAVDSTPEKNGTQISLFVTSQQLQRLMVAGNLTPKQKERIHNRSPDSKTITETWGEILPWTARRWCWGSDSACTFLRTIDHEDASLISI